MAGTIRVGIVGATVTTGGSGWGANAHIPALNAVPDFEVTAVCTAHEDTARASAEAFGVKHAFHDIHEMAASPEVDLVVVVVRAPLHRDLVMAGLEAGKAVFCEWPLGANLAEAEEMAAYAREHSLRTIVGLQGRNDPATRYARDLVARGEIGEVLTANLTVIGGAALARGAGRLWQRENKNGANTLTIAGGHNMDAMCMVLGEFTEVAARAVTQIKTWHDNDNDVDVPVDSPDTISVSGRLESGAEVSVHVAAVPAGTGGARLEIYGREGSLLLTSGGGLSTGPNRLYIGHGRDAAEEMQVPTEYAFAPEGTPTGPPRNVAHGYARLADAFGGDAGNPYEPDFEVALKRHRLIDAIERSTAEGRTIKL